MSKPRFYLDNYFASLFTSIESNLGVNKEVELRFTEISKVKNETFQSPLDSESYRRIKDYLIQKYGVPSITHSEDRQKNGKRQTIRILEDGSYEILAIEKKQLWDSKTEDYTAGYRSLNTFEEYGIKLAMSKEVDTKPETDKFSDPDIERNKHRLTWKNEFIQFDLTKVEQTQKGRSTKTLLEFEMELTHPLLQARTSKFTDEEKNSLYIAFFKFDNQMRVLWNVLNDSDIIYKRSQRDSLESLINDYLSEGRYIDSFVTKARNLEFYDMIYGGVIGGKFKYTVTPKAEGLRKFLVVNDIGVWLVYPGDQYSLIEKAPLMNNEQYKAWRWFPFRNTIIDGEDILPERRKENSSYSDIKHFYLPFDTLIYKGEDVRNKNLIERQKLTDLIRSSVGSSSSLLLQQKPFVPVGNTAKEFYEVVNDMFETMKGLDYHTDGVVFTPINAPYNPHSEKIKGKFRNLTNYADICKWKPENEYTIDLKVIQTPSQRGLFASKGPQDILFTGSRSQPFDVETQVDWFHPMFANIHNNDIVEFGPKLNSDGQKVKTELDGKSGIIFVPIRIREDKVFANSIDTSNNTWKHLNDPITEDTIRGNNIRLVRKYHNRVKAELFNIALGNDNHLIDIGSGYGGDISKTEKYTKILAIEPDPEHMEEFRRRLKMESPEKQSSISTLIAGGEEYESIMEAVRHTFGNDFGRKPLYISMMLSLSFFWKSEEMLQQLANTINLIKEEYYRSVPKGFKGASVKFLFLTIDGEKVVKLMKENNNSVNLNGVLMNYKDDVVYIDIPGTIVDRQTEYPVYLKDLQELTDMEIKFEKVANEEKLLSEGEIKFTSLYKFGEYNIPNKPIYLYRKTENLETSEPLIFPEELPIVEVPINSTLFFALFKAFNPELSDDKILPQYVLLYRKEISDAISNVNPFDLDERTIFASASNGFLEKISENEVYAKQWILSDNELTPDYISWIPDTIGANLLVNGILYETSVVSEKIIELDYEDKIKVYTLR
jgi:hypothetical protein